MTYEQDAVRQYTQEVGKEDTSRAWILSPYDSWERNPYYDGPPVRHPEEDEGDYDVPPAVFELHGPALDYVGALAQFPCDLKGPFYVWRDAENSTKAETSAEAVKLAIEQMLAGSTGTRITDQDNNLVDVSLTLSADVQACKALAEKYGLIVGEHLPGFNPSFYPDQTWTAHRANERMYGVMHGQTAEIAVAKALTFQRLGPTVAVPESLLAASVEHNPKYDEPTDTNDTSFDIF